MGCPKLGSGADRSVFFRNTRKTRACSSTWDKFGTIRQRTIRLQALCIRIYYTMRETVTISLPKNVRQELDRVAKQEGVSRSDVLRQSLEEFLFARRFRALRSRMMAAAQAQGIFTEEDVFERIS